MFCRILVVRGGAVGDFIVTLPVWAALRRAFPNTELGGLVSVIAENWVNMLVFLNIMGVLMIWNGLLFFVPAGELDERAVEWLSGFDAIISICMTRTAYGRIM